MKPLILPDVRQVTAENIENAIFKARQELTRYQAYAVGKKSISTCPACLDTETTTVTAEDGEQYSFIWIYQIQVGRYCFLISDRDHLLELIKAINTTCEQRKIYLYLGIANTKYEWSFLCKDFSELIKNRPSRTDILSGCLEPLAVDMGNIIICDLVRMANSSLAKIGKDYCTTQKLKGDLNYDKIRNSLTINHLTEREKAYCINDVVVGAEYLTFIHDRFTKNGKRIPLTSTGFIRNLTADEAYRTDPDGNFVYADILKEIYEGFPTKYKEYSKIMNYLFRGGYTHGNYFYCGDLLENIEHIDYTSDYPAVLLQNKYPYKFYNNRQILKYKGKILNVKDFESENALKKLLKYETDIAFYFTATFENIQKITPHTLESTHKTLYIDDEAVIDNGRIARADKLTVMLTEQDLKAYLYLYKWDEMTVRDLHIGLKKPLPPYMIKSIVSAYVDKKRLKDTGLPYAVEKALLNSVFGLTCQRIQIEDEKDIITAEDIKHIKSPVKFCYLNINTERNERYFTYIKNDLIKIYGYDDTQELKETILSVYQDMFDGNDPKHTDKVYMSIYNMVVDKLQQRAYYEAKRGGIVSKNQTRSKMLSPWFGIWCTAYARARLIEMIHELEKWQSENSQYAPLPIVVYYDTDSLFLNCHQTEECYKAVRSIIDQYNATIEQFNETHLKQYDNIGLLNDLGQFDWEQTATHFKQLGAKRYLQRFRTKVKNHRYKIRSVTSSADPTMMTHAERIYVRDRYIIEATIAGLNKTDFTRKVNAGGKTIKEKFDFFTHGMFFSELETSKLVPSYNFKPYSATVTDEFGNTEIMHERCGQVLKPTSFKLTMFGMLLAKILRVG